MLEEDFRLRVFVTVARLGNFTAAARELGISQPAVSQNVNELERQVGKRLLDRSRSLISLTEEGKLFKPYADQILHWYRLVNETLLSGSPVSPPQELRLSEDVAIKIWSCDGDLHIKLKQEQ